MKNTFEWIGLAIDATGVGVILIGFVVAGIQALRRLSRPDLYQRFRHALGKAILLGLEFMVAGDIVRTVAVEATLENVIVLIGIVFIRTFLSFALQLELDGSWPWERKRAPM